MRWIRGLEVWWRREENEGERDKEEAIFEWR